MAYTFFWIVGSVASFFSVKNAVMPLVGAFGGLAVSLVFFSVRLVGSLLSSGSLASLVSGKLLAFHVPGLCASLSWSVRSSRLGAALMQLVLPLACMALFALHPVGSQAVAYSLYWLVPVTLYVVSRFYSLEKSVFAQALSSTFIAHAVGSVIWLYAVGMSPAAWLALIPVVFVERLLFAAGMTGAYYAVVAARSWISRRAGVYSFIFARKSVCSK
jgi:hypothetical protein